MSKITLFTRLHDTQNWRPHDNAIPIEKMDTTHIINLISMLLNKPEKTLSMLLDDVDSPKYSTVNVPTIIMEEIKKDLRYKITSQRREDLVSIGYYSPLFRALINELNQRGLNSDVLLTTIVNNDIIDTPAISNKDWLSIFTIKIPSTKWPAKKKRAPIDIHGWMGYVTSFEFER